MEVCKVGFPNSPFNQLAQFIQGISVLPFQLHKIILNSGLT